MLEILMKEESDLQEILNSVREYNNELFVEVRELKQENMDKEDEIIRLKKEIALLTKELDND
tara:strand:+ start:573 stop:758 length:186 start_codon:yes stop_codon:yes gene_type:complete